MLRDLHLKKAYSSDVDDILNDFYIPALSNSIEYRRLAGFFSSTCLAIAARGIVNLIKNEGTMKLIVSPYFQKKDHLVIEEVIDDPMKFVEEKMLEELNCIENDFINDHVRALGWMLANKYLEIRVALVLPDNSYINMQNISDSGIFHQKVAVLTDVNNDIITFSGSINESAMGWLGDVEEFKVFRSWETFENEYVQADLNKFNRFWDGKSPKVRIMPLPQAVAEKLIKIAPNNIDDLKIEKWYKSKSAKWMLHEYQKKAIASWFSHGMKGIFEMATGTGKTFTALGCVEDVFNLNEPTLVIITCPFTHLVNQWAREIQRFRISYDFIFQTVGNPNWRDVFSDLLREMALKQKKRGIIITTHDTFSNKDFISTVIQLKKNFKIFLIADEVHGVGAEVSRKGLIAEYDMRLGLSATPKRFLDEEGTDAIYNYFSGVVFEFSLVEAINRIKPGTSETYLTPYRYFPKFISLTQKEMDCYEKETRTLSIKFNSKINLTEKEAILKALLIKRANIIKNAEYKYKALEDILEKMEKPIKWTIIYCTPQQIDNVMNIVNKHGLKAHRFTMKEGTKPEKQFKGMTERDYILDKFAKGELEVLVAMRCLDEGVDVPPARNAILMASSGNPREYIQRIGRVIRHYENKAEANIYDLIVKPSLTASTDKIEKMIFEKEIKRSIYIASIALNNAEATKKIYENNVI